MVSLRGSRSLTLTASTTSCSNIREKPYKARLEIIYDYLVEYRAENEATGRDIIIPDVIGVGNAVAFGVADALDSCGADGSPLYAVELASRHHIFEDGFCQPVDPDNTCKVIRGFTGIRLDTNVTDVEDIAYDAIRHVLDEPLLLDQFVAMSFARTQFVRPIRSSVLQLTEDGRGRSASKVVIAICCMAFFLVGTFLGGLFFRKRRKKARRMKQIRRPEGKERGFLGAAPRNYYELNEHEETEAALKVMSVLEQFENPSQTWSVSDITSESESIMSNLSKATSSKLERIEESVEEGYESQSDDEWDGSDTQERQAVPLEHLYDLSTSPRHHINQWDVGMDAFACDGDQITEPEGCRYLDASVDENGYQVDSSGDDSEDSEHFSSTKGTYDHESSNCETPADLHLDEAVDSIDAVDIPNVTPEDYLVDTSDDSIDAVGIFLKPYGTESVTATSADLHIDDTANEDEAQPWLQEFLKGLQKAQTMKLLTYSAIDSTTSVSE